ncbi:4'-phosphopantetheinyl transferase family protein [Solemya elarraichensis gill symbiont]|nr:4'-phosphopantetheinyl transferase superfamily protein [Solemya elarraichensis gill symbiont]
MPSSLNVGFLDINIYHEPSRGAYLCQCEFDPARCDTETAQVLGITLPHAILRSVKKRRAEFIAGRYMAKLCLKHFSVADYDVDIGAHREPIWPLDIIGTISHCANQAVALVAKRSSYRFVGIDIERFINKRNAEYIGFNIHDKYEFSLLLEQGFSNSVITTLIFSAKESLFKAIFSYIKKYIDFECARVTEVNVYERSLVRALKPSLSYYCYGCNEFKCYYFMTETSVTTIILE